MGARNFDGTNDRLDFGSDASIDDFTTISVLCWVYPRTGASNSDHFASKTGGGVPYAGWYCGYNTFSNVMEFGHGFTTTAGNWTVAAPGINARCHWAVAYDRSATTNDPTIWLNNANPTKTESSTPVGTSSGDNFWALRTGENGAGNQDYDGQIAHFVYVNGIVTAEQVNRHYWWGRIGGACAVIQPLLTDKLNNEGTATANGGATGSAMGNTLVPPTQRPCSAMMGLGVGW